MPDPARIRDLLADSLALWGVAGAVEPGVHPAVAVIRAADGATLWVERLDTPGVPFRWQVRSRGAGEAAGGPGERRPRACASLVGVLGAVREALGIERGSALRIAPAGE